MHQFQPYPIDLLEINPFTKISNEWMLIAAGNQEKVNAMTASWGGLGVLWGKNVAFIFVREKRYTKEFIDREGRIEDKFKASGMTVGFRDNTPYVDESNFHILCKKMAAIPMTEAHFHDPEIKEKWYSGTDDGNLHTLYVGEIIEILAR